MRDKKKSSIAASWRLIKPYWVSEDKLWAFTLLIAVIILNLASVFISVRANFWSRDFFNALQDYNFPEFKHQFVIFGFIAAAAILVSVYQAYLLQMLQIRWRRWLTDRYVSQWLDERAYYRMQLTENGTDNPDQRIAEDLNLFTSQTLSLSLGSDGFFNAGVTLLSFLGILWSLSGPLSIPLGGGAHMIIPGYMVWCALLYAIIGTWLTFRIGRPLVPLNFAQQRLEADFRFSLMRLRENAESVALYGGEGREKAGFIGRFHAVVDNFWTIMKRTKRLNFYSNGYRQLAVVFPYIVAAPRYFAKTITFGDLQQTADAFGQVQQSLSFIVNSYTSIATWQSVVERLDSFESRVAAVAAAVRAPQRITIDRFGSGISVAELDLEVPKGSILKRGISFAVRPHEWTLITGPSGVGKSTLLRALAGIWPYGSGKIRIGEGNLLFSPQRPYIPLGSLADVLLFPTVDKGVTRDQLRQVLHLTGLDHLKDDLDVVEDWAKRLSPGEQQKLAFARIFLAQPAFIFMDEATSALDEESEAQMLSMLREASWRPTVLSVGHRQTIARFHDETVALGEATKDRP